MEISLYNILCIFIVPIVMMTVVYLISPSFIKKSLNNVPGRYGKIEPLRGVAASMVAVGHSFFSYNLTYHGAWSPLNTKIAPITEPSVNLISSIGNVGVILFFMITGFLFIDKAIKLDGKVDFKKFYIGRFFRIVPAYTAIALFILIVAYATGFYEYETWQEYLLSVISWLTFGLSTPLSISSQIPKYLIIGGVLWTLNLEWKFYFLFPFFCQFISKKVAITFVAAFMIFILLLMYFEFFEGNLGGVFLSFMGGAMASFIMNWSGGKVRLLLKSPLISILGLLICVSSIYCGMDAYTFFPWLGIFILFVSITQGSSVMGILDLSSVRWLGAISYSLYLSHGVFLFLFNKILMNGNGYIVPATSAIGVAIMFSVVVYHFVEQKGISIGKMVAEYGKHKKPKEQSNIINNN